MADMQTADVLIRGATVVTMNPRREVLRDGAVAISGERIVAVGPTAEVSNAVNARDVIDGARFVVTPGMVNTHIHITGEPLTRGYVPDDTPFEANVFQWLCPLYATHTEDDERLSAQLAAAEMLKPAPSTTSTPSSTGWRRSAFGGAWGGGRGTCRRSRRATSRPPTRPSPAWRTCSPSTARAAAGASRRGR
jgi:hypothetical protein